MYKFKSLEASLSAQIGSSFRKWDENRSKWPKNNILTNKDYDINWIFSNTKI